MIRGFEASFDYNFYKQLFLYSNITTTYGQNKTNNEPVGGIPPTFGLIGLNWKSEYHSFYFYVRFAAKQDRLSADDKDDPRIPEGGTPGWETLNFRTRFSFMKFVNLQFAIENILDYNFSFLSNDFALSPFRPTLNTQSSNNDLLSKADIHFLGLAPTIL